MPVQLSHEARSLWTIGRSSLQELEFENGITASLRTESYGCIFGRDSLITGLLLMSYTRRSGDQNYVPLVRKILTNLSLLQGREENVESGEEPGKCIHEFRPDNHAHLTTGPESWYVYPDGSMRNYDTADATAIFLLLFYEYFAYTGDFFFMEEHLEHVHAALGWILTHGDKNGDGLLDYSFHPARKYGGLKVHSWMDSTESLFFEHRAERPAYPIAPVEVQAYTFTALLNFADFFRSRDPDTSKRLSDFARALKTKFNQTFVKRHGRSVAIAYAVDGTGEPLWSTRSSAGHILWASYLGGRVPESIVEENHVAALVRRLMQKDMYVPHAGMRTLSSSSKQYDPVSYHNGSIWPHDSAMVAEGFENFGYAEEAHRIRTSLLHAYRHFNTPIELFGYAKGFKEYQDHTGHRACRVQAWSAASLLLNLYILGL